MYIYITSNISNVMVIYKMRKEVVNWWVESGTLPQNKVKYLMNVNMKIEIKLLIMK